MKGNQFINLFSEQETKKIEFNKLFLQDYKYDFLLTHLQQLNKNNQQNTEIIMQKQCNLKNQGDYVPSSRQFVQRAFKRWTAEQNLKYIKFLNQQEQSFKQERTRRISKVFKRLSLSIGTKTQSQCKSHHQKMISQHKSIEQITKYFAEKYGIDSENTKIVITSSTLQQSQFFESMNIEEAPFLEPINIRPLLEFQQPEMDDESIFDFQYKQDGSLF